MRRRIHEQPIKARWGKAPRPEKREPTLFRRLRTRLVHGARVVHRRNARGVVVSSPASSAQRAVVKVAIVRRGHRDFTSMTAATEEHMQYLQREGVELGGEAGRLYGPAAGDSTPETFLARVGQDPHQFRLIVSAEQAGALDLTTYTHAWMGQLQEDLGTQLDWVAVNHYNTANPHTHVVLRGVDGCGKPLYIQPQYLMEGMRYRAQEVATRELGPRMELPAPDRTRDVAPRLEQTRDDDFAIEL